MTSAGGKEPVYLLDYGAGNVRSVRNAVAALGFEVRRRQGRPSGFVARE